MVLPLEECVVALSGTFSGHSQAKLEQDYINHLGGTLCKSVTKLTTHLITTEQDFAKPSTKVKSAKSHDIHILKFGWLEDCLQHNARLSEDSYSFVKPTAALAPASTNTQLPARKRAKVTKDDSEDDQPPPKPSKKTKTTSQARGQSETRPIANGGPSNSASQSAVQSRRGSTHSLGETNKAKSSVVRVPVDEHCPLAHYSVYIDDTGMIYDASLNQTNSSNNNNKFYRIQLLRNGNNFQTWTRWGRVGDRGQSSTLGSGSLADAMRFFETKFKDKSGLAWADRGEKPKSGKYTFVERAYASDSDSDDAADSASKPAEKLEAVDSKLLKPVQDLMALIFNQEYFAATMSELNYDVQKLPLGKLSKGTITRGYQALKDLSALIDDPSLAQSEYGQSFQNAAEDLSNSFFSLIPHAFGRNRPPIIHDQAMLKREIDMLDSLSDMKEAANIMKDDPKAIERINILDQQFKGLNLAEMTPLREASTEFVELKNYLIDTRGSTHNVNYKVDEIFRIERNGEQDRFKKSPYAGAPKDRRLLWHGSRCTNFGGILSQGLRIAPPEAPVSGYMFGKGIYLADMSSKSANYCVPHVSNGHALLLLCEAELGNPIQVLTNASYSAGEDAKAKGMLSTWGQGVTGPKYWKDAKCVHPSLAGVMMPNTGTEKPGPTNVDNAFLQYNEYITYDTAQVNLRYLFRVRMF